MTNNEINSEMKVFHLPTKLMGERFEKNIFDTYRELFREAGSEFLIYQMEKCIFQQSTETLMFIIDGDFVASIFGKYIESGFLVTAFYINGSYCFDAIMKEVRDLAIELYGCVLFGLNYGTINNNYVRAPGDLFLLAD